MTGSLRRLTAGEPEGGPREPFDSSRIRRYRNRAGFRGSNSVRSWHAPCCSVSRMDQRSPRSPKVLATAALFLAAVGAVGCASSDYARRTADDARLSALVEQRLTATSAFSAGKVRAKSHCGVVALVGEVWEEQMAREAERLAVGVPGVVRVNNLILVVKGDSQAEGSPLPADSLLIARTP
jgi:hypothetical protein